MHVVMQAFSYAFPLSIPTMHIFIRQRKETPGTSHLLLLLRILFCTKEANVIKSHLN